MAFLEYIETLGLLTKEDRVHLQQLKKLQKEQQKQQAKKAEEKAAKIVELDAERFNRRKKPAKPTN